MTTTNSTLQIGTRSSPLALVQTRDALAKLTALFPSYAFRVVALSSPGDRDQATDLRQTPADFFTQDLDRKILAGELDGAIHSAKDLPDPVADGLDWFWLPWREDARDALIRPHGLGMDSLPPHARIGISSDRRAAYCRARFPEGVPLNIRGTIESRLQQLDRGDFDLILMAGAALNRLGLQERITEWIPLADLPPPDGQGSLAVTFRAGDPRFLRLRRFFTRAVTFAAAGVGSSGHCTLECLHALQRCDICLHDTLLGHDLFALLPPHVRCLDVGKRCGQHSMPQDETTYLITRYARRGLKVVRLKGGDPGIFGRLAEEVEALDALELPYRVLPGVSSLMAATTTTGMLLTRRGVSRGFTVMTPRKEGGGTGSVAMDVRKNLPIVFFMALAVADEIARQLIADGHAPETPAAVVLAAGSDQARTLPGTLATIAAVIRAADTPLPGLLIVGEAARYRYPAWGALRGCRVLLTASDALQEKAADLVHDFGGIPVRRPLIRLETTREALAKISRLESYDWVVLTSPSAVRCFGELLRAAGVDLRRVPTLVTCGGGTSAELATLGLHADIAPESSFSAEGLLQTVTPRVQPGLRILRLRSDKAGPELARALQERGALVDDCLLYVNRPVPQEARPEFDLAFFASASAVEAYDQQWGAASLRGTPILAIGQPTLRALRQYGLDAALVPPEATVESAIETLAAHEVRREHGSGKGAMPTTKQID